MELRVVSATTSGCPCRSGAQWQDLHIRSVRGAVHESHVLLLLRLIIMQKGVLHRGNCTKRHIVFMAQRGKHIHLIRMFLNRKAQELLQ